MVGQLVDLPFGKSSFVGHDWIWLSLGGSASVLWWPSTEVMGVFRGEFISLFPEVAVRVLPKLVVSAVLLLMILLLLHDDYGF